MDRKPVLFMERTYRQVYPESEAGAAALEGPFSLFEDAHTIIVLGEPGMGKTFSFEKEAKRAEEHCYIRAIDMISLPVSLLDVEPEHNTIFVDGLDEVRAKTNEEITAIGTIIKNFHQLELSKFRLSCRSQEWYSGDTRIFEKLPGKGGKFYVVALQPLGFQQIQKLAIERLGDKAQVFLEDVHNKGLYNLLENPLTLRLFIEIYADGDVVNSRFELFEKACIKLLKEENPEHSQSNRGSYSNTDLIDAAGYLCAIYLMTNSAGLSSFQHADDKKHYPYLFQEGRVNPDLLKYVARTRLFKQEAINYFTPIHRTIAEYLAARYIVKLFRSGQPWGRIINIITGHDGGTLSDLRGLFVWIATLYSEGAESLFSRDPIGILTYGDVGKFNASLKKVLLNQLYLRSLENHAEFYGRFSSKETSVLLEPALEGDVVKILEDKRADASFLSFLLDLIRYADPITGVAPAVLKILNASENTDYLRESAIKAYYNLQPDNPEPLKRLLDQVHSSEINDKDNILRGALLDILYPSVLKIEECLRYLVPKNPRYVGSYDNFQRNLVSKTPPDKYVDLANAIISEKDPEKKKLLRKYISTKLVLPLLKSVTEENALSTMHLLGGIMFRNSYVAKLEGNDREMVTHFYKNNSEIYKILFFKWLEIIEKRNEENININDLHRVIQFHDLSYPQFWGYELFDYMKASDNENVKKFLYARLLNGGCIYGVFAGPSLETLYLLMLIDVKYEDLYYSFTKSELEERGIDLKYEIEQKIKKEKNKEKYLNFIKQNIISIESGEDYQALFDFSNLLIHDQHKFTLELLYDYLPREYSDTIIRGLKNQLHQEKYPEIDEVINNKRNRSFMYGCRLAWEEDKEWYKGVSDEVIKYAIAIEWYDYNPAFEIDDWFVDLINYRPELFVMVFLHNLSEVIKNDISIGGNISNLNRLQFTNTKQVLSEIVGHPDVGYESTKLALQYLIINNDGREISALAADILSKVKGELLALWRAALFIEDSEKECQAFIQYIGASQENAWAFLDLVYVEIYSGSVIDAIQPVESLADVTRKLAEIFEPVPNLFPGEKRSRRRATTVVRNLINAISSTPTVNANTALRTLIGNKSVTAWRNYFLIALRDNEKAFREKEFEYPTVESAIAVLTNGKPQSYSDLKELVKDHLKELAKEYEGSPFNQHMQFWNTDGKSKDENTCRDLIALDLQKRLAPLNIHIETEGTQRAEKRSDIKVIYVDSVLPIEIKKNSNCEIRTGIYEQLKKQYSNDPKSSGYGIYLALWFGSKEQCALPKDIPGSKPTTAGALKDLLISQIKEEDKPCIEVIVMDLSKPLTSKEKNEAKKSVKPA